MKNEVKAAIYCRTSTAEESQVNALEKQINEARSCVKTQGWLLADSYIESGSGTTTKGREQYNRLYEDLLTDKFHVIVIKSQDRLMRNVKDWYLFLDRLLSNGKRLFIYIENKFYEPDDALITGIKAILAEEYSRELSKKINNAHKNRQKNGGKPMLTSRTFGYTKNKDGSVSIAESEARIVEKIYQMSASGFGAWIISNTLREEGCHNERGNYLGPAVIRKLIRNPLYKGTMVMNRLHYDFDRKKVMKVPREMWVYEEGLIPPIVNADLWQRANDAMTKRAEVYNRNGTYRKGGGPGKYQLSGKLICGHCGRPYYRVERRAYGEKGGQVVEWKCRGYVEHGRAGKVEGCDNVHLEEKNMIHVLEQLSSQYYNWKDQEKENILNQMLRLLEKVLSENPAQGQIEGLEREEREVKNKKELLLSKLLDFVISDKDYQRKNAELEAKLTDIHKQKESLKPQLWEKENLQGRIETIKKRLLNGGIDEATVYRMLDDIDKIVVHEWFLELCFNPLKLAGFDENGDEQARAFGTCLSEHFRLIVEYPFSPETERGRYLDRLQIISILKKTPDMTGKKIAREMGRTDGMVRNRMEELIQGGYIRFHGKGGRGFWEIQKAYPDIREEEKSKLM